MGFYSRDELLSLGFSQVGEHCRVSRLASFHAIKGFLGHHVRIDDYTVLTGQVQFGSYIHIAPFCMLSGNAAPLVMKDCSGLSSHCAVYTASDDYRSATLSNPAVPDGYKNVITGPVLIGAGALIGSHSVILPSVTIGDGASVGAHCLIYKDVAAGAVCVSRSRGVDVVGQRDVGVIKALIGELCTTSS